MKKKRPLPIIGLVLGLILGLFFELYMWSLLGNGVSDVINMSTRPAGAIPFGPGIPTVITAMLELGVGILVKELINGKQQK